jgi:predicted helicase
LNIATVIASEVLPLFKGLDELFPKLPSFPSKAIALRGQDPEESLAHLLVILRMYGRLQGGHCWPESQYRDISQLIEDVQEKRALAALRAPLTALDKAIDRAQAGELVKGQPTAPVILGSFYEQLLAASNQVLRKEKGAYYTPKALIRFMVDQAHRQCQQVFDDPRGLANTSRTAAGQFALTIMDPAAGTGLFILEIIRLLRKLAGAADQWARTLLEETLPRLHGIELMYVPYQISRLDLEATCPGLAIPPAVFQWGNSLEGPGCHRALKDSSVFIGNPPYSAFGQQNRTSWILGELEDYKEGLKEKKINLDDDFIKFIRLAHTVVKGQSRGLISFVTNNSYLDSATRRGLRRGLLEDFAELSILNLGGDRYLKNRFKDDENLFDIQCGISVLTLSKGQSRANSRRYHELTGQRQSKIKWLEQRREKAIPWTIITPSAPHFSFFPERAHLKVYQQSYKSFHSLTELFEIYGSGVKTDRDKLCYDHNANILAERMNRAFANTLTAKDKAQFRIKASSSYDLVRRLAKGQFDRSKLRRCLYRPFDRRWLYYAQGFTSRPARKVMQHMIEGNIALLAKRQARDTAYDWFFVARGLIADGVFAIDNKGRESLFPLKLSNGAYNLRIPESLTHTSKAGEFFNYIYALVHSPSYRNLYQDFLRRDFPRIALAREPGLFSALALLGARLISAHTGCQASRSLFPIVGGSPCVLLKGYPRYQSERLNLSPNHFIAKLPEAIWNFTVGGQRICQKWLKDRRGLALQREELDQYRGALGSIAKSIDLMERVDEVIRQFGGWPGAFHCQPLESQSNETS